MKTHIFDMDGLLIDSEPFWRTAEIAVFTKMNIPFTEDMCRETVGMRIDEVIIYWNEKLGLSMPIAATADNIVDELINQVQKDGQALPGVLDTLKILKENNRKVALASSSSMRIIEAVIDKLQIRAYFDVLHSAEFEEFGKPHPAVFLTTAKLLGELPSNCIVYEDSKNGMRAGLSAGMKTVIIPEFPEPNMDWHDEANDKWKTLKEFNLDQVES